MSHNGSARPPAAAAGSAGTCPRAPDGAGRDRVWRRPQPALARYRTRCTSNSSTLHTGHRFPGSAPQCTVRFRRPCPTSARPPQCGQIRPSSAATSSAGGSLRPARALHSSSHHSTMTMRGDAEAPPPVAFCRDGQLDGGAWYVHLDPASEGGPPAPRRILRTARHRALRTCRPTPRPGPCLTPPPPSRLPPSARSSSHAPRSARALFGLVAPGQ